MTQPAAILEREGVLGETLPQVLRESLPSILERHRQMPVHMMVTTMTHLPRHEILTRGSFFRPPRQGHPPEFTWKASGAFQSVLRQFRLDFLRHLGRDEMQCRIRVGVYPISHQNDHWEREPAIQDRPESPLRDFQTAQPAAHPSVLTRTSAGPGALAAAASLPVAEPVEDGPDDIGARQLEEVARSARVIDAYPNHDDAAAPPETPEAPEPPKPAQSGRILQGRGGAPLPGNLYQDFFGFESMPFNNTPDSHFYFPSPKHQEALSRLIYAISERKGFVMISGEIGSGKSTLCRTLLAQLPSEVKTALISQTNLDATQLIRAIADDLGLETDGQSPYEITQRVNQYLIEQLALGATVCIIIDEAQNLPADALEEVRMISNLETEKEKLVQLILLGQPNLRDKINLPELVQLRQRIAVQYHLEPLDLSETMAYIRHRLTVANPCNKLDFSRGAMKMVYRYSGGVPRLINTLCDNGLLTSFIRQKRTVTPKVIEEAARDLALEPKAARMADILKFW